MHGDGSYTQLPGTGEASEVSQQALIRHAQERIRQTKRLKRRKPQGMRHRNI